MSELNSSAVPGRRPNRVLPRTGAETGRRKTDGGEDLIALAQKLARDAERHAILSASLASQAERLMVAGLRARDRRTLRA